MTGANRINVLSLKIHTSFSSIRRDDFLNLLPMGCVFDLLPVESLVLGQAKKEKQKQEQAMRILKKYFPNNRRIKSGIFYEFLLIIKGLISSETLPQLNHSRELCYLNGTMKCYFKQFCHVRIWQ